MTDRGFYIYCISELRLYMNEMKKYIIRFTIHTCTCAGSNINFDDLSLFALGFMCWWASINSHWKSFLCCDVVMQVPEQTFVTMRSRYRMISRLRTLRSDDYSWLEVGGHWCVRVCVCASICSHNKMQLYLQCFLKWILWWNVWRFMIMETEPAYYAWRSRVIWQAHMITVEPPIYA